LIKYGYSTYNWAAIDGSRLNITLCPIQILNNLDPLDDTIDNYDEQPSEDSVVPRGDIGSLSSSIAESYSSHGNVVSLLWMIPALVPPHYDRAIPLVGSSNAIYFRWLVLAISW
jgi:hypothetical protein